MEYVVFIQGRAVWGPRPWLSFSIEQAVEFQTGKTIYLSPTEPSLGMVDESIGLAILQVVDNIKPPYDPVFEQLAGPTYSNNVPEKTTSLSWTVVEETVPYALIKLKNEVAGRRWSRETSGVNIEVDGKQYTFSTNRTERDRLMIQSIIGQPFTWKLGNDWVTLTPEKATAIVSEINNHVQNAFQWELNLVEQINNCETIDQARNIFRTL